MKRFLTRRRSIPKNLKLIHKQAKFLTALSLGDFTSLFMLSLRRQQQQQKAAAVDGETMNEATPDGRLAENNQMNEENGELESEEDGEEVEEGETAESDDDESDGDEVREESEADEEDADEENDEGEEVEEEVEDEIQRGPEWEEMIYRENFIRRYFRPEGRIVEAYYQRQVHFLGATSDFNTFFLGPPWQSEIIAGDYFYSDVSWKRYYFWISPNTRISRLRRWWIATWRAEDPMRDFQGNWTYMGRVLQPTDSVQSAGLLHGDRIFQIRMLMFADCF